MDHYDAIVIGGGVAGCAAAYHLARGGRRTLLLEQYAIGHANGSSHGHSRIIRLAYDAPGYVRLMQAAYPLWRALEEETGAALMLQTGGLDLGPPGAPGLAAIRAALLEVGVPFEELDRAALRGRFPQFAVPVETAAIYQADAGILDADRCVAALAAAARAHGAVMHEGEAALRLAPTSGGVEVETGQRRYGAERLVLCAGSWAGPLLRQLGLDLPLTVTKEQVAFFRPHDLAPYRPGRMPIFIEHAGAHSVYGFPVFGLPGVKVALHAAGPAIAPEDEDRAPDEARLAELRERATTLLPGLTGEVLYAVTCRYTMTPDEHFILDLHPAYPQVVVGSACSGHGFKFGVLTGRILADLAERGATGYPIEMFRIGRPALRG
ncbi:MAG TPA: N-methyl-L-tryptophan oxidase [Roseiflexaceae bacterium]|nr:N-methyl-L-tryptophan oxidase [Roseiflexaceae bacterium]